MIKKLKNLKNFNFRSIENLAFLFGIVIIGTYLRFLLFPKASGDMNVFLIPWYNYIKENGGFLAVGDQIGDYTPAYYYIMAALTYLPVDVVHGIKYVSCFFDFILAIYVMWIVDLKCKSDRTSYLAFAVVYILPTVVLNSASWGQCDVIFTTFIVMSLYYILIGKDVKAMICFGLSFVFKIQVIFFAPVIVFLLLKKRIRFRTVFLVPLVYIISIIPAVLVGGDLKRLLTVYFTQAGQYKSLNLSLPNIWTFFRAADAPELGKAGIFFAGAIVLMVMYYFWSKKNFILNNQTIVGFSLLFALLIPYLLPYMHERYYYLADVLTVIFIFYNRDKFWLLFTSQYCSLQALLPFLFKIGMSDETWLALIPLINIITVAFVIQKEFDKNSVMVNVASNLESIVENSENSSELIDSVEEISLALDDSSDVVDNDDEIIEDFEDISDIDFKAE